MQNRFQKEVKYTNEIYEAEHELYRPRQNKQIQNLDELEELIFVN